MAAPQGSCLSTADVLQLGGCFTGIAPPGHDQASWATLCAQRKAAGVFDQPFCPDVPRPALPSCLDAPSQRTLAYCQKYGWEGPDAAQNALCWAGQKDEAWWASFSGTRPCDGTPASDEGRAWVVGGAIVLLALGGIGAWMLWGRK